MGESGESSKPLICNDSRCDKGFGRSRSWRKFRATGIGIVVAIGLALISLCAWKVHTSRMARSTIQYKIPVFRHFPRAVGDPKKVWHKQVPVGDCSFSLTKGIVPFGHETLNILDFRIEPVNADWTKLQNTSYHGAVSIWLTERRHRDIQALTLKLDGVEHKWAFIFVKVPYIGAVDENNGAKRVENVTDPLINSYGRLKAEADLLKADDAKADLEISGTLQNDHPRPSNSRVRRAKPLFSENQSGVDVPPSIDIPIHPPANIVGMLVDYLGNSTRIVPLRVNDNRPVTTFKYTFAFQWRDERGIESASSFESRSNTNAIQQVTPELIHYSDELKNVTGQIGWFRLTAEQRKGLKRKPDLAQLIRNSSSCNFQ